MKSAHVHPSLLRLALVLVFSAGCSTASHAASNDKLLDAQQMLLINGQPRFILGLYENPKDDAVLQEAVAAGFNLIRSSPTVEDLDRIQRAGAHAWINLGDNLDVNANPTEHPAKLKELVQRLAQHPALLIWEGPDEVLWNHWYGPLGQLQSELDAMRKTAEGKPELDSLRRRVRDLLERGLYAEFERARAEFWTQAGQPAPKAGVRMDDVVERVRESADGITAGIQLVRALDPRHVIWLNHAPRNSLAELRLYNRAADMVGCDIYPAPANLQNGHSDLADQRLTAVGAYTRRMRQAAPGKACAMVLQGFGWRDLKADNEVKPYEVAAGIGRRPSFSESRFMAYDAIINGANGIFYWGTAFLKPVEDDGTPVKGRPRLWRDLLHVVRELHALAPALVAPPLRPPRIKLSPTYGSIDDEGVLCSLRRVGDDYVLLVVNENADGIGFAIDNLPAKLNGRTLYRLYSPEEKVVSRRGFRDGIRPQEVHVYSTSRRFEASAAAR